jgi:hypothetical protein
MQEFDMDSSNSDSSRNVWRLRLVFTLVAIFLILPLILFISWWKQKTDERKIFDDYAARIAEIVAKNEPEDQLPIHDAKFLEQIWRESKCVALIKGVVARSDDLDDPRWTLLARFPNLENLTIYDSRKSEILLNNLCGRVRLKRLSICKSPITNGTMKFIAASPSLRYLHLMMAGYNTATPEPLKGHEGIKTIWLEGVPITEEWVRVLQSLPRLKELDVKGSDLDARAKQDLEKALPRCKVMP